MIPASPSPAIEQASLPIRSTRSSTPCRTTIVELEKDLGTGNPASVHAIINFYSSYTVFMGFNIATFIEQNSDAEAQFAFADRN